MFLGMTEMKKGVSRPKEIPPTEFKKLSVLGSGMMGRGIAYVSARAGIPVVLKDVTKEAAESGKAYCQKLLEKDLSRGKISENKMKEVLSLIQTATEQKDLTDSDLVIEAVTEDRKIKEKVIKEAEAVAATSALISSNTSTLPITGLAEFSKKPDQFIGLHFFSPVEKMPLVEIILGKQTSDEALAKAIDYVRRIRKVPVVVQDGRGFYTSRVFASYINEGIALLREGVPPAMIENAGKIAGMPVGPLAVADEVSLDLVYHIIQQTEKDLEKKDESPAALVSKLFVDDLKRLGRKVKKGFYDYPEKGPKVLWVGLQEHFPASKKIYSVELVKRRLLYAQALEAARAYEAKIVGSPRDADVASILGWGFAPYTGGVLSFIDEVGLQKFVKECAQLEKDYGPSFHCPPLLETMAQKKQSFYPD